MPDRKNQDRVLPLLKTVERHVTGASAGYHQFPQCVLHRATDQWVTTQQCHRFLDQPNRLSGKRRIDPSQEVGESFEIGKCPSRIAQPRQDPAFGFTAFLPAMRAFK